MIEWEKKDETTYAHTIKIGEPLLRTFLYSFGKDPHLGDPEINSVVGNRLIVYRENIDEDNSPVEVRKIPSLKEFVETLPIASVGVADYYHRGHTRRVSLGLNEEESLKTSNYVLEAKFFKDKGDPDITREEITEFLDRLSNNAVAYSKWLT